MAPEIREAKPYRTALHSNLEHRHVVTRVRDAVRDLLVEKGYDPHRLDAGDPTVGPGAILLHAAGDHAAGWQIREHRARAFWVSTVTVVAPTDPRDTAASWVSIHVGATHPPSLPVTVGVPRLVTLLLDRIDLYDGYALLKPSPTVVGAGGVDDLLDIVCAPRRRLATLVAAPARDMVFTGWRDVIATAMAGLPGLASMYLLEPSAMRDFTAGIGEAYAVPPGGIRTYLPGVDPAIDSDAARHRILSRKRLRARGRESADLLATAPRDLAARTLPAAAGAALVFTVSGRQATPVGDRHLAGIAGGDRHLATATVTATAPATNCATAAATATATAPNRAVGTVEIGDVEIGIVVCDVEIGDAVGTVAMTGADSRAAGGTREVAPQVPVAGGTCEDAPDVAECERLHEMIAAQHEEILDLAAELEVALDALEAERAANRALHQRLAALGGEAASGPADPPLPKSFGAIMSRIDDLAPLVVFTGDAAQCVALDEHTQAGTWAQVAWTGLVALADYAQAKRSRRFDGDFTTWCTAPPGDRRTIAPGKVARHESTKVRTSRKFAPVRTFPVPRDVDPQGRVFMRSHIRLGNSATVAPRVYFFDDAAHSGSVYVGYIGRHLANTHTAGS